MSEYQALPTKPTPEADESDSESIEETEPTTPEEPTVVADPRFERPVPSPWKRGALLLFIAALFYIAISMRVKQNTVIQAAKVIHAKRYSQEYQFRPAASPVVTERLKDGRVRLRGAQPVVAV